MGDSQSWNNMDDREKQGLVNSLKRQDQDTSTFVDVSGDTMTGTLEVPGFIASSTASLSAVRVTNQIIGSTLNLSGAATLTGPTQLIANASGTNPVTIQFADTIIGGSTIAPLRMIASAASQAFIDFRGAIISTASLSLSGANVVGLVRVWFQGSAGNAAGWLPIFKDAIAL